MRRKSRKKIIKAIDKLQSRQSSTDDQEVDRSSRFSWGDDSIPHLVIINSQNIKTS